jgi:hypothetical protein
LTPFDFPAAAVRAKMPPSSAKDLHVAKRMSEMVEGTLLVDPHLERELGASPTAQQVEEWRRRIAVTADPSTVLGALLSRFDGLSVEHNGVRATIRWFGAITYACEKCLVVFMELSTGEARAGVLALARHCERLLGLPVSPDAAARLEELLRDTIEESCVEGALPETHFSGTVYEFFRSLPARLLASAPAESLGNWVLERVIPELVGEACEVPLPRSRRLVVLVRADDTPLQPAEQGIWFAPIVSIRRISAKGKLLSETEQQVYVGFLGTDTRFEPLPDAAHRSAALEVLRRWKGELARRIARQPNAASKDLVPMNLAW